MNTRGNRFLTKNILERACPKKATTLENFELIRVGFFFKNIKSPAGVLY